MILRRLTRLIGVFCVLFVLIGFFPVVGDFFSAFYYRDIYINHNKYKKKLIIIDSLAYENTDGSNTDNIRGYSKELNNYKTQVLFGHIRNDLDVRMEGMDDNGNLHRYVWYREGMDTAYPGEKGDKVFPIETFISKKSKIPVLWLLTIFISLLTYKISTKSKLFKDVKEYKD